MKSFSQRKGFKPVTEVIQIDSMNSELRNSLWNVFDMRILSNPHIPVRYAIEPFSQALWFHFFKKPIDSRPVGSRLILSEIRGYFFGCAWSIRFPRIRCPALQGITARSSQVSQLDS